MTKDKRLADSEMRARALSRWEGEGGALAPSGAPDSIDDLHPLLAVLLAGTVPLFLAVLLSDLAYSTSHEIQWKNFASWLLVGGLVCGGFALLWAVIVMFRDPARTTRQFIYVSLLVLLWVLGFINALVHAGDAWASMPAALTISAILAVLAIAATWLGFSRSHRGVTE